MKTKTSGSAALNRALAAAVSGALLFSGCVQSVFTNPQPYRFEPSPPAPTPSATYVDTREMGKYDSSLPDAFALDPNCLEQISFNCLDFDEVGGNFVYFYQYTYADDSYQRRKRDYDQLSADQKLNTAAPESSVMLTALASHNYKNRQTTEFFRAVTPYEGGISAIARKPPDMDGYALYFDKKVYYYTRTGELALEADCAWAYDQLTRANSGYPQHDLADAEVLNEGRRFVVSLMMSQEIAFDPKPNVEPIFSEPRTGQFTCEVVRIRERPAGYGRVLSYDLAGNVTSFAAKPRYQAGEVTFALTETAFAGRTLSGRDPDTGKGARLPELEAKYVVNQPLPSFQTEGNTVKGVVTGLTKRYAVVRVPRREYQPSSFYYSSSVPLKSFDDYFDRLPPEPTAAPVAAPADAESADVPGTPDAPPEPTSADTAPADVPGTPDAPPDPTPADTAPADVPGTPDAPPDPTPAATAPARPGGYVYIPGTGFTDTPLRTSCYILDAASVSQPYYKFEGFQWDYLNGKWEKSTRMADVLIPNADGLPTEDTTDRYDTDPDYTGWIRTVWQGVQSGDVQAYEDMRFLEGYDIEIAEDSYVYIFRTTPDASVLEKPLYGGGTLFQSGDAFSVKDLISGAGVAGTARTIASAKDFGALAFAGGSPVVGYVVLTEPGTGSNVIRIHTLGSDGQISQVSVPFQDIHFISSEEQARTGQTEPEYMRRYEAPPTFAPEPDGASPAPAPEPDGASPAPSPEPDGASPAPSPTGAPEYEYNDDAYNADRYTPESVLALDGGGFVITSIENGAVRYYPDGGVYKAQRILEAPIYRSWRLADGSFIAVGFELQNPAKRYDMTDFARGKVLTYTLS